MQSSLCCSQLTKLNHFIFNNCLTSSGLCNQWHQILERENCVVFAGKQTADITDQSVGHDTAKHYK